MSQELPEPVENGTESAPVIPTRPPYWPLWPLQPMPSEPRTQDKKPRQVVPGHSILGKGFNIFGRYNSSSARKMLFDTTTPSERTWHNTLSGNEYIVPEQVDDPLLVGAHEGSSHIFSSRADVSEYFAAEAGMNGRYRVFSGEFKAAFSSMTSSVQDYHMGLYSVKSRSYKLRLKDDSESQLYKGLLDDPDYKNLPARFDASKHENVALFFAFFAKFGTHYVNEVVMGSRLDYFMYANKANIVSQIDFEAKLKAEVKAVFFATKAEASVIWNNTLKSWASSRSVRISSIGSMSILNSLVPEQDQNFHEIYVQWLAMSQAAPMPVEYKLKSIADIFSGEKAIALRQAMDAYASKSILLKAVATPFARDTKNQSAKPNPFTTLPKGFVNVNENLVISAPTSLENLAIIIVVQDARTLAVKHQAAYEFPNHPGNLLPSRKPSAEAYDKALDEFNKKFPVSQRSDIIVSVLIPWVLNKTDFPTSDFYNFLVNLGAGDALNEWWRSLETDTSVLGLRVAYGLIGMFRGATSATVESFVTYYSQDRSSGGLILESFLEPTTDGNSFIYIPS